MSRTFRSVAVGSFSVLCLFVLATSVTASEDLWQTGFEAAKGKAKAEKKLLLVDFTGSDWCIWCKRLKEEVFDKEAFQKEAPQKFVLVELDFPHDKELPEELKTQNDELRKKYNIHGYPTILVLDAEGQLVARTGYRRGGAEDYVQHLNEFVTIHESVLAMRAKLDKVQGIERAKLLDQLVDAYTKLKNEIDELGGWSKEIVALDADNKAGLKVKHEFRILMAEATKLKAARDFAEAKVTLDKALALVGITGEQKQDAYFALGECLFYKKDYPGLVACLKNALEAAPDSPKAKNIEGMIQRYSAIAKAQEVVTNLKAKVKTAEGLDRAKLLDQLVDAAGKLNQFLRGAIQSAEIEAWSKEIVKLDADNKAGLKGKYEVAPLLAEARKLSRSGKIAEAQAMLEEILARPGLKGEQVQDVQMVKASTYLSQKELQKCLDCYKKAIEAAPKGSKVPLIKAMAQRCESELEKQKKE